MDTSKEGFTRIGIIGTGFIASGLQNLLNSTSLYTTSVIRTRRKPEDCTGFEPAVVTNSDMELVEKSDIVI